MSGTVIQFIEYRIGVGMRQLMRYISLTTILKYFMLMAYSNGMTFSECVGTENCCLLCNMVTF